MTKPLQRLSNPAGRLLSILESVRKKRVEGSDREVSLIAWGKILQTHDTPTVLRRMGMVIELPDLTEKAVLAIPDVDHRRLLAWKPELDAAFKYIINLRGRFDEFAERIDPMARQFVGICKDFINSNNPDQRIDLAALEQLLEQIQQLSDEVQGDNDLDPELQRFILHHLFIIEQSIIDYRFQGLDALTKGLEQLIGKSVTNAEVFKTAADHPKYGGGFTRALGVYALAVTSVVQTLQLPSVIQQYLPQPAEVQVGDQKVLPDTESERSGD